MLSIEKLITSKWTLKNAYLFANFIFLGKVSLNRKVTSVKTAEESGHMSRVGVDSAESHHP